jgi:curved DNA-binding protein CbpA
MGRGRDGQYFRFCLEHVRQYNQTYNYFDGMSDAEVAAFQKDAVTGHRPTWRMGSNLSSQEREEQLRSYGEHLRQRRNGRGFRQSDGSRSNGYAHDDAETAEPRSRPVRKLERRALEALDLPATATKSEIKIRFKALVKLHHPDSNGGDKSSEEKLREVIQAYNYLKQAGLV